MQPSRFGKSMAAATLARIGYPYGENRAAEDAEKPVRPPRIPNAPIVFEYRG